MSSNLFTTARARLQHEVLQIEKRDDLTDNRKVGRIIVIFSTLCGAIGAQPIPWIDILVLLPLQACMAMRIAAIRGLPLGREEEDPLTRATFGVVGVGLTTQQLALVFVRAWFAPWGGVVAIPLLFGLTFAMGKVMDLVVVRAARKRRAHEAQVL